MRTGQLQEDVLMNDPKIPNYPVVHVTVHPDGSAHVNAAGDHQNYPAGDVDATRERVLVYAIAVATRLGRGAPDDHRRPKQQMEARRLPRTAKSSTSRPRR